ncbi:MAG: hypothetical protein JOZ41_08495 [Chloroflexi bacterium]|nr:hypothetical protein [Chloroflexota bacterium]
MNGETAPIPPISAFAPAQERALSALRTRFQLDADFFSDRERAHLLFLRWLCQTGRVDETEGYRRQPGQEAPMATA